MIEKKEESEVGGGRGKRNERKFGRRTLTYQYQKKKTGNRMLVKKQDDGREEKRIKNKLEVEKE